VKSRGQTTRVRDRMTRAVATTHPEVPVMAARELMRKRMLRHLPVVDQRGRLVGIITDRDLRQVVFIPRCATACRRSANACGR
jgi:CBS domain-containing protein